MTDHPPLFEESIVTTHSGNFALPQDSVLDVLVIGAGQSGLAIGRQLQQRGRSFLIVDAGPEIGHVWRSRWDSLTLFTAARYSGLPFPGDPHSYPPGRSWWSAPPTPVCRSRLNCTGPGR